MNRSLGLCYLTCSAFGSGLVSASTPQYHKFTPLAVIYGVVVLCLYKTKLSRAVFFCAFFAMIAYEFYLSSLYYKTGQIDSHGTSISNALLLAMMFAIFVIFYGEYFGADDKSANN